MSHELVASILRAPDGGILAVDGADLAQIATLFDEHDADVVSRKLLLTTLARDASAQAAVEMLIDRLAGVALKLWPFWFADTPLPKAGTDTLGRLATVAAIRRRASHIPGALAPWAEAAALLALEGRLPRVPGTPQGTELAQLARLVGPGGLVLLIEIEAAAFSIPQAAALVHCLEWASRHMAAAIVGLYPEPPQDDTPFDRIRANIIRVAPESRPAAGATPPGDDAGSSADDVVRLLPWRGLPHPLSAAEQRIARLLCDDTELGPLFEFNRVVHTVRGSRPRVDLLWPDGRLVVELDGYADHGTRPAFIRDRQRDFELALSGYTVLRLANDEIAQDCWLALEKIRDLVRHRRRGRQQEE